MFIHKYSIGDKTLYMVSDKASKPSKIINIGPEEWRGMSSGATVSNIIKFLGELSFKKDVLEKEPEEKEEKKKKTATIVMELDAIANEIQPQNPIIAYYIDRISDSIENR